jgi:tRNA threonylcarbamoyladenosine biosynthesis protein TsaB
MLLVLESSAGTPSLCLVNADGHIVFQRMSEHEKSHAECLPVFIQEALDFISETKGVLLAVALNEGPGSYTGLRIGTSLVKGLCFGLQIPLIAVPGLQALGHWALQSFPSKERCFAMIDARRDEVYVQIYSRNKGLTPVEAQIITSGLWEIDTDLDLFVGNANTKAVALLGAQGVACEEGPYAPQLVSLALQKWRAEEYVSVAYFEPFYLKEFQAGISKKFSL